MQFQKESEREIEQKESEREIEQKESEREIEQKESEREMEQKESEREIEQKESEQKKLMVMRLYYEGIMNYAINEYRIEMNHSCLALYEQNDSEPFFESSEELDRHHRRVRLHVLCVFLSNRKVAGPGTFVRYFDKLKVKLEEKREMIELHEARRQLNESNMLRALNE